MCKNRGKKGGDRGLSTETENGETALLVNHFKVQSCEIDLETSCREPLDLNGKHIQFSNKSILGQLQKPTVKGQYNFFYKYEGIKCA
jgi:hypothetical protein